MYDMFLLYVLKIITEMKIIEKNLHNLRLRMQS
jgi:hypothetical protein